MHAEDHYALRALRAGAAGYVNKDSAAEDLSGAVRKVLGRWHPCQRFAWPKPWPRVCALTARGQRTSGSPIGSWTVCRALAAGKTVKEIGVDLALSEKTVSTYRTRLLEKMQMRTNAELIQYAIREGLVD